MSPATGRVGPGLPRGASHTSNLEHKTQNSPVLLIR
jgi:hypothetical protein